MTKALFAVIFFRHVYDTRKLHHTFLILLLGFTIHLWYACTHVCNYQSQNHKGCETIRSLHIWWVRRQKILRKSCYRFRKNGFVTSRVSHSHIMGTSNKGLLNAIHLIYRNRKSYASRTHKRSEKTEYLTNIMKCIQKMVLWRHKWHHNHIIRTSNERVFNVH